MDTEKCLITRRSIFPEQFTDKEVAKGDIEHILAMANWAPTHKRTEPWRFKVATGRAKEDLAEFFVSLYKENTPTEEQSDTKIEKTRSKVDKSAAVIAICMQRDPKERLPEWEEVSAVAMAVQNMWLMVTALGLGGYWSSPGTIDQMHRFFDLAEGEKCLGFFYLGHHAEEHKTGRRDPIENKVEWL
ncbi:nitroreductase [Flavimarina sp. Hel_I_48]|uniref:nitroreductase family protein n=1 Tax=Flavimarina sp. Hel_I_48 TaxID=1392488 RepID=UPI0004DF03CD|nr:nitroreductase [Flavimarina sp. Hel_I_48]